MNRDLPKHIPKDWTRFELLCRQRIHEWILENRPTTLTRRAREIAAEVCNRKDGGLIFMDFDEWRQRGFLRAGYLPWIIQMTGEIEACLEKAKKFSGGNDGPARVERA